jgi:hypothetical protein
MIPEGRSNRIGYFLQASGLGNEQADQRSVIAVLRRGGEVTSGFRRGNPPDNQRRAVAPVQLRP